MSSVWKVQHAAFVGGWRDVILWCFGRGGRLGRALCGGGEAVAGLCRWLVDMIASYLCVKSNSVLFQTLRLSLNFIPTTAA